MARRFFRNVVLGTIGTVSTLVVLSGGASQAANGSCPQCELLRAESVSPESASLGSIGAGNLRDGINIASIFNRNRSFDRVESTPMGAMLDPRRNPFLASAALHSEQPFPFAPWGAFAARPEHAADPAVLFPTRVQPLWSVSQGYPNLGTSPWTTLSFGNPDLDMPMIGRTAL